MSPTSSKVSASPKALINFDNSDLALRVRQFLDHLDWLEPGHLVLAPLEPGVLYRAASLRSGSRLPVAPLTRHLWH